MMRNYLKFCVVVSAAALIGMTATIASAGNLGLVDNGDMELVNRFAPWGDPDDGDPNWAGSTPTGRPDAFHHSATPTAVWSDPNVPHPVTSGIHALWLEDSDPNGALTSEAEFRSYAGDSGCCVTPTLPAGDPHNTGNIPGGNPFRSLDVSWSWDYSITNDPNQVFTGTVRTSSVVGTGLDLTDGGDPNNIVEYNFFTGTGSSGGYVGFSVNIPIAADVRQFDIIFNTGDRTADDFDGRLNATGTMFVDDVRVDLIPEPASLLLLSVAGVMVLGRRRR